jgi:hypothetical protein
LYKINFIMKNSLITFTILFFVYNNCYAQDWTEDFETQTSNQYGSTTISINNRSWTRKDAGNFTYAQTKTGSRGFTINDDKVNAHITTPLLNTCGTVSFKYAYTNGSSSNVFQLQISTDGTNFSTLETHTLGASANENYVNYSYNVNNLSNTIYLRILSDDQNAHLFIDDFSVTSYSGSSPGISLGLISGNTNESGTTATFTTVLDTQPTDNVIINLTSSDTNEVTVNPTTLTFTNSDWDQTQTITVTGVDDSLEDGNTVTSINLIADNSSDDNYDGISTSINVINEDNDYPNIVITEIMYNSYGTDDEWIEIYNGNGANVDISSWSIAYSGETFTFPVSTTISDGQYITIALGSNGDGIYNNDNPFTPDFNNLSGSPLNTNVKSTNDTNNLNNTSGTIALKNNNSETIDSVFYSDDDSITTDGLGSSYEIINTSSNNSDTNSNWQSSLINGGTPGQKSTEAWDTNNTSSSDLNVNNSNHIVITTSAAIQNITINSGSSLTVNKNGSLTVSGNLTNNGTVTLNSDANEFSSIIVEGTSSGNNITYNRYVNTVGSGEWDLIGSPVGGLSINSFITANGSSLASNGTQYAIGRHFNDTDSWKNYASDGDGTNTLAIAGDFNLGEGYQMASASGETLAFTGTVATSTQTQSVINNNGNGSGGRRWNLVANPFPSYLNLNTQAHATNNFLKVNIDSEVIDSNFGYLYGWDADGSGYTIYNNNAGDGLTDYIAPGQGFFVAAASSGSISLTPVMRTTSGGDDFISGRLAQTTWSRFYLRLYQDESFTSETQFYFDEGLSLGLDPGHDAGAPFEDNLMSRLPENDQGIGMAINAMGLSALNEETVIPLVLNRDAGVEFSISFEDSTIPEDVGVYLEDTLLETLTDLRSEDFTLTPESDLSDMGRFYLRIGNTSLGGNDLDESYISIYKAASDDFVTIEGLSNVEKANVQLFNIIGQEVLNTTLNSNQSTQRVSTSGLTTGVYVIRLQADSSVIAKKIIIN